MNFISIFIVFQNLCFVYVEGQICAPGTLTGPSSLLKKRAEVDSNTARTYVHTDGQYMFKCCGVVEQWKLFVKNPGNINLQVWRPVGATMELVGENTFTIRSKGSETLPVQVEDRITVQYGDYIGWHSDVKMLTFSAGTAADAYSLDIVYDEAFYSGGNTAPWLTSTVHSNRLYAVIAVTSENSAPFLSDLSLPKTFYQSDLEVGTPILVSNIYDVDTDDFDHMTISRLDTHHVYFAMNVENNSTHMHVEFVISNIPPVNNFTIQFEVQDICFNSVSGSADLEIQYRPLVIQSLPNVVTIHSNTPSPKVLHMLVVRSDVVFGCTIESVNPAVSDGTFIIDTASVKVMDHLGLTAPNTYDVEIKCIDAQGSKDTKLLSVNSILNTAPRVDGFQDSVLVDILDTSVNDVVQTNVIVDDEGDDVIVASYCDQDPCSFQLLNNGDVICTDDLKMEQQSQFVIHFAMSDDDLISEEYIQTLYLQNLNSAPYISNLSADKTSSILVSELTGVGTKVFKVNGVDDNPTDRISYTFVFDQEKGDDYFGYSTDDGSIVLIASLDFTLLSQSGATLFGVNISVSDGKVSSKNYILEIQILPQPLTIDSTNNVTDNGTTGSSAVTSAQTAPHTFSMTNIVLAIAAGFFVLISFALFVALLLKNSRTYAMDLNSSTAYLDSTHSRFRVMQVEPLKGPDSIYKISNPKMTSIV